MKAKRKWKRVGTMGAGKLQTTAYVETSEPCKTCGGKGYLEEIFSGRRVKCLDCQP